MLEDVRLADDKEEEVQQKLLLKLYLNCALCSLKLCVSKRVRSLYFLLYESLIFSFVTC